MQSGLAEQKICKTARILRWGHKHSVGHYPDLWSALLGAALSPIGYLLHALARQDPSRKIQCQLGPVQGALQNDVSR